MTDSIILTATEQNIRNIVNWGGALIVLLLTARAMNDFIRALNEPENGLKDAFRKTENRIYAAVIAITAETLIYWIQRFF